MKLALISLDKTGGVPPLGLAYIASYLREYSGFDNTVIIDKEDPLKKIKKEKPDVVGISSVTSCFTEAVSLSKTIKQQFDITTIIGGVHISLLPHKLPETFDVGVINEGEQTVLELVNLFEKYGGFRKEDLIKTDGIVFYENDNIKITKPTKPIEPLDKIPYPARDLLRMKEYYLQPRFVPHIHGKVSIGTHIVPGRGCPYRCKFCSTIWKGVRFFSAEYLLGEVKLLIEDYKINNISFYDDLFIANRKRLEDFADLIVREKINEQAEFGSWGRTNLISEGICKILKKMNLNSLSFGFESGSDKVLKYLKGENISIEDHIRAIELCKKYDIKVSGSFMIGNPFETKQDIEQTFDFIKKHIDCNVLIYITTPLPGTPIWELAKERGLVSEEMDWNELDLVNVRENKKVFFLPKDMTEKEFYDKFNEMRNYVEGRGNHVGVKFSYFFNPFIIKKVLTNPRTMIKHLKRII